jgi:hypothetical protein
MKLDRTIYGKYAVVRMRRLDSARDDVKKALALLIAGGFVTMDCPGGDDEFFVVFLRDKHAPSALVAYSNAASADGEREYAQEVLELAARAGINHPKCKRPD